MNVCQCNTIIAAACETTNTVIGINSYTKLEATDHCLAGQ